MYRFEIDTSKNYENIVVEKKFRNDVFKGYRITPKEGYLLKETITEYNEETKQSEDITTYSGVIYTPSKFNFDEFKCIAVLEDEINI